MIAFYMRNSLALMALYNYRLDSNGYVYFFAKAA